MYPVSDTQPEYQMQPNNTQPQYPAQKISGLQPTQASNLPVPEHLEPYRGWMKLKDKKDDLLKILQVDELAAQQALKNIHPTGQPLTITEREEAVKSYRAIWSSMVEKRRQFTGYIELQLFTQVMEPEKRLDPKSSAAFTSYAQVTLNMKLDEEKKATAQQAIQQELAQFEAFLKNEYSRVVSEYRIQMYNEIDKMYRICLQADVSLPAEKTPYPNTRQLKEMLVQIPLGGINRFNRQFASPDQLNQIWSRTPQPNFSILQEEMLKEVDSKFALYANDLAVMRSGGSPSFQEETAQQIQQIQQEASQEMAANTLIAHAESVPVIIPEGKPVKRSLEPVIVETEAYATAVIMNWIKYPDSHSYARNRKWSTLDIAQMATALAKYTGEKAIAGMQGMEFKEVIK